MIRPLVIFFLLIFLSPFVNKVKAETFLVTSNEDSGPGTLREAITLANANGIAEMDYIFFNIPFAAFNDRIINLAEQLPSLSSNITIDASSQPGESYGNTNAKICLKKDDYAPSFSLLRIENAQNVQIYSLYLFLGYWEGFFTTPRRSEQLYGITIESSENIQIGAANKGNVINGASHGIYSRSDSCRNIIIQANYMGIAGYFNTSYNTVVGVDVDEVVTRNTADITLSNVKDIRIGGPNPEDGNIISGDRGIDIVSKYSTNNGSITIQYNSFGRWFDRVAPIAVYDFWNQHINIGASRYNYISTWPDNPQMDYSLLFLDNDVTSRVTIRALSKPFLFLRNKFAISVSQQSEGPKLSLSGCSEGGNVGNNNTEDGNIFEDYRTNSGYEFAIRSYNCGPIEILKNVFRCNVPWGTPTSINHYDNVIPFVQMGEITPTSVSGIATPNSRIDLYYDDDCNGCEGEEFISSVYSDELGSWIYNGSISKTVVAIATKNGYSSQFSVPLFDESKKVVKQPTCGAQNGRVTGITGTGAHEYFWINHATKDTVSRTIDLLNVGPGYYTLFGKYGENCYNSVVYASLEDATPKILANWSYIQDPSCGLNNGFIRDILINHSQYATFEWQDAQHNTISNALDLFNLAPGTYSLIVKDTTLLGGCSDTTSITLVNNSGPSLNTDNLHITTANCEESNGAISGITIANSTGLLYIEWLDSLNNLLSNSLNLNNVSAGKYILKIKDESSCDTIITPFIIPTNGSITLDEATIRINATGCTKANGSITGITTTGATSWIWRNTVTNAVVGNTINAENLSPGNYQLTITNAIGCEKTSAIITVPPAAFADIQPTSPVTNNAFCNEENGSIAISGFVNSPALQSFEWFQKNTGISFGNNQVLNNIGAGIFDLVATDTNGCKATILTTEIKQLSKPVINTNNLSITNDNCEKLLGAINGLQANGLLGPTTYTWQNANNEIVGTGLQLNNITAGNYTLTITDKETCIIEAGPFNIQNNNVAEPSPEYDNLIIQRNTAATLKVKNAKTGVYILYNDANGSQVLAQNETGIFQTTSLTTDRTFYIQYKNGICISPLKAVKVTVIDKSYFAIATAFTPNGDGKNDKLHLNVIGYLDVEYFQIFNRNGEMVFSTKTINQAWDGMWKGNRQPQGVYVWTARGKDINGKTVTDKGSFVLIK